MTQHLINKVKRSACKEWRSHLTGKESLEDVLKLFVTEPQIREYCYTNNYPSLVQLREIADLAFNYGIIIDKKETLFFVENIYLFGNSEVTINIAEFGVCNIICRHDSKVTVIAPETAIVFITLYDQASCSPKQNNINIARI